MECLLEKVSTSRNNPNESSTIKINNHTPSGSSLLIYWFLIILKISLVTIGVKTA